MKNYKSGETVAISEEDYEKLRKEEEQGEAASDAERGN